MDSVLTDAQWEELCEWVGFRIEQRPHGVFSTGLVYVIISPEGEEIAGSIGFPPRDMNTIFKWFWYKLTIDQRKSILEVTRVKRLLIHWQAKEGWLAEALITAIYYEVISV